ncbi:hypothetical protein RO3G_09591 [Lichtheimia corymbifera JMRC:FSU:9682]|uniref:Uncharacterized protein n=1 Tax=Lichtheimia corymbifera JMRC:FSU:9682 TaxID=1263082 RepID=A0A068RIK5_9FUNG|nr:hypothetical protein RO3G_09591 [Lichtheimia corymbifera JMRC:FSU:9682]
MSTEETNGKGQQHDDADERTALIQSSTQSYSTQEQQQQQQQEQEILTSVVDVEAGVGTSTVEQEERPMVSEVLMTKTVKKVIRQHRRAQVYISEQSSSTSSSSKRVSKNTTTTTTTSPVALLQRRGSNTSSSSSSSSDSSSSSSSDEEGNQRVPIGNGHQRVRKRDQIKNALKSATQQWKDKHGWSSSLFLQRQEGNNQQQQQHAVDSSEEPLPPLPVTPLTLPPVEVDIYRVTGVASVCTLLAMAKKSDEKTQRLAISTLHHSIKATAHTRPMILREVLLRPHLKGLCALEWAVENECHLFLSDRLVQSVMHDAWWLYGASDDWNKQKPEQHPYAVWSPYQWMPDYFARWASPRYQALAGLACGIVYLALHLATVANVDYQGTNHVHPFEYAYYVFVSSDALLFFTCTLVHPLIAARQPSSYVTLTTVGLLVSSFVVRFVGLFAIHNLERQAHLLYWSYTLLAWATPLMFFRVVLWHDNLCWNVYKARFLVGRCVVEALWAIGLGVMALVAFWLGLAALQRDDTSVWAMLRYLALGALHAPAIAETLYFQPVAAGIMLFVYLVVMILLVGSLIVASVLTTLIATYPHLDTEHNKFLARRASCRPSYGVFIPNFAIGLVIGAVRLLFTKVFKMDPNSSSCVLWLDRIHQVLWFIVFLPVIVLVALIEGIVFLYHKIRYSLSSGYHQIK